MSNELYQVAVRWSPSTSYIKPNRPVAKYPLISTYVMEKKQTQICCILLLVITVIEQKSNAQSCGKLVNITYKVLMTLSFSGYT